MTFWDEVLANFLGAVFAGSLFVLLFRIVLWFLRATDVIVGYNWSREGTRFHPTFDIRNRSCTKHRPDVSQGILPLSIDNVVCPSCRQDSRLCQLLCPPNRQMGTVAHSQPHTAMTAKLF